MKDSISSDSKIDLDNNGIDTPPVTALSEVAPINQLPEEILLEIFNKIPPVYFAGNNPLATVCQHWNTLSNDQWLQSKKSLPALINSCENDPQAAIYALADEVIFKHLSFTQIMNIAGCVPELVSKILFNPLLNERTLLQLALKDISIAKAIWDNKECRNKLSIDDLVVIGCKYLTIAQLIWNNKPIRISLKEWQVASLAFAHFSIAQAIWEKEDLQRIKGKVLAALGANNFEIAKAILNREELWNKLKAEDLVTISKLNPIIAQMIWDNEALQQKLKEDSEISLLDFCLNHLSFANIMFEEESKSNNPNSFSLGSLCANHFSIMHETMNNTELLSILLNKNHDFVICLGQTINPEIAQALWNNETLRNALTSPALTNLGLRHPNIAQAILDNSVLRDKLTSSNLIDLGCKYVNIAQFIWENSNFLNALKIRNLLTDACVQLSAHHLFIAKAIWYTPDLLNSLTSLQLAILGRNYFTIAKRILENESLRTRLKAEGAENMAILVVKYPTLIRYLLDDKELSNELKTDQSGMHIHNWLWKMGSSDLDSVDTSLTNLTKTSMVSQKIHEFAKEILQSSKTHTHQASSQTF